MANSVLSVQSVNALTETQPAPQSSRAATQNATQSATPQDKVTISPQALQALANNAKPSAGGDVDHDGDNRWPLSLSFSVPCKAPQISPRLPMYEPMR